MRGDGGDGNGPSLSMTCDRFLLCCPLQLGAARCNAARCVAPARPADFRCPYRRDAYRYAIVRTRPLLERPLSSIDPRDRSRNTVEGQEEDSVETAGGERKRDGQTSSFRSPFFLSPVVFLAIMQPSTSLTDLHAGGKLIIVEEERAPRSAARKRSRVLYRRARIHFDFHSPLDVHYQSTPIFVGNA